MRAFAVVMRQERTVVHCSDDEAEALLTRVTMEPAVVVPDDSDAEEVCCAYEWLGDENGEDRSSFQDAPIRFGAG
jgi:hypothetical protein